MMDIGDVVKGLKEGKRYRRRGWNGRNIFIELLVPDKSNMMTHPFIFIDTTGLETNNKEAPRDRVPWLASQTDILSEDWEVY